MMGLQLKRTPVMVTRFLLGSAMVTLTIASPLLSNIFASKIAAADTTPDISKIHFVGTPKYVRENNAGDLAAQLTTYAATTDVNFYIDGKIDEPIAGSDHGGGKFHQWRLYTAVAAGKHTITAQVRIAGEWYDATGSATVYSLDLPAVSYVFPTSDRHIFRSSDNSVRVKADDEFDQFRDVSFSLYHYDVDKKKISEHINTFKEKRSACDLREAGNYVLCDLDASEGWTPLPEGVYAIKLTTNSLAGNGIRTSMDDYWVQFTVDDTKPVTSDFRIEGATTVKDSLVVSTNALDAASLESVDFYVTAPRDSDGVCTGNGVKLAEQRNMTADPADGRYRAVLDVSGIDTQGKDTAPYCVTAVARDEAKNNSDPSNISFMVDHKAPVVTLKVASSKTPSASTPVSLRGAVDGTAMLELFADGTKLPGFNLSMSGAGQWNYTLNDGLAKGDHVLKIVATDPYGNSSTEALSPQSYASLAVGAYVPPVEKSTLPATLTPPKLSSAPVTPTPSVAQIVASQQQKAAAPKDDNAAAILGAETAKHAATDSSGAVIAPSSHGWTFFGIAWYWWLLGTIGISAAASRIFVRMRRDADVLPA